MKPLIYFLSALMAAPAFAWEKPRYEFEMPGREYQKLIQHQAQPFNSISTEDAELEQYLLFGSRALAWVDLVNSSRAPENRISLTSAATEPVFPPSSPRFLSFPFVREKWAELRVELPPALSQVIFDGDAAPVTLPVLEREFIEWLALVDVAYQHASRYVLLKPIKQFGDGSLMDLRGYLNLIAESDLDEKLAKWDNQSGIDQKRFRTWLLQACHNLEMNQQPCDEGELDKAIASKSVADYWHGIKPGLDTIYSWGFQIYETGGTLPAWTADNVLHIPFVDPADTRILDYLRVNIEDEWRWQDWKLKLDFTSTFDEKTPHVVFEPGATPHVGGEYWSQITMDENAPLTEYDTQWTIRHEFGHVLGFPDCYIEYYDAHLDAFVAYQLDTTNLMCSRRGHIKQIHFDELKRMYGPK